VESHFKQEANQNGKVHANHMAKFSIKLLWLLTQEILSRDILTIFLYMYGNNKRAL